MNLQRNKQCNWKRDINLCDWTNLNNVVVTHELTECSWFFCVSKLDSSPAASNQKSIVQVILNAHLRCALASRKIVQKDSGILQVDLELAKFCWVTVSHNGIPTAENNSSRYSAWLTLAWPGEVVQAVLRLALGRGEAKVHETRQEMDRQMFKRRLGESQLHNG